MKDAVYSPDKIFSERIAQYDKNGNILGITRNGYVDKLATKEQNVMGEIDNLTLSYNGNQLTKASETDENVDGVIPVGTNDFRDRKGAKNDKEYLYDANGNMTGDYNKNIVNIKYYYLNLPEMIQFSNGNTCEYLYDALGVKHRVIYRTSLKDLQLPLGAELQTTPNLFWQVPSQTDYCGNFIHEYGDYTLKKILTPEGYIQYDMDYSYYCYNLKDHLGNNRVLLQAGADEKTLSASMITHYYPFGMEFSSRIKGDAYNWYGNPYRYNGKEIDRMHGLNWYDYGARWYDPTIAKWSVVDPLGEKYYSLSPYVYCANNPINAVDPDGGLVVFINGMHNGLGGKPEYWGGFANKVMNQIQDWNAVYIDGSHGGTKSLPYNLTANDRNDVGYENGKDYARLFLFSYKNDDGSFKESIKVITHSMGAAYAKGFIKGLISAGVPINMIEFEADFAPFQPTDQKAVSGIATYQYSHNDDDIAGKEQMPGAKQMDTSKDEVQDHGIKTFINQAVNLPEGKYKYIDGKIVRIQQ